MGNLQKRAMIEAASTTTYSLAPSEKMFPPPNEADTLWRYMGFAKLVSLLDAGKLYFARADRFNDRLEGTFGGLNATRRIAANGEEYGAKLIENKRLYASYCRRRSYLCCWHRNEHESAAMWAAYGQEGSAVAIVLPAGALRAVLPSYVPLRQVRYEHLAETFVSEETSTSQFFYKRQSFEHEREVRAIVQYQPEINSDAALLDEIPEMGLLVGDGILSAITRIHVAPDADEWFLQAAKSVCRAYGLKVVPQRSELDQSIF